MTIVSNLPFVSIVIPCRNEEKFISKCIDSIIINNYPKDRLEILVINGMSTDKTREIVATYTERYNFIKLLNNPKLHTASAFNIGIRNAYGDIIITAGSHTTYSSNYVFTIATYLKEYDCVGSIAKTLPSENTIWAKTISIAISNPFGVGNSYMRIGTDKACLVDTASCPGYKREVFEKIGLFNEKLVKSQDIEFNSRLKKSGGRILLLPEIVSYYYPRSSTLKDFFLYNFKNGIWSIYPFKYAKMPVSLRHLVPFAFVLSLIGLVGLSFLFPSFWWLFLLIISLYFLGNMYFTVKITKKEMDFRLLFIMPIIFATLHVSYGLGSIWGTIKLLMK